MGNAPVAGAPGFPLGRVHVITVFIFQIFFLIFHLASATVTLDIAISLVPCPIISLFARRLQLFGHGDEP